MESDDEEEGEEFPVEIDKQVCIPPPLLPFICHPFPPNNSPSSLVCVPLP